MKGWEIKTLGEVCLIKGRIGYRGYTKNDIVIKGEGAITLSPSNIKDNKLNFDNCTYISWFKYDESPEIIINEGDIIYCKTASIGKTAFVEHLPEKATINPQFVVLKNFNCINKFVYYFMISENFKKKISGITGGTAIPTLSQENLGNLEIPVPSLSEQKNIVSILDETFATIEHAKENLKRNLQNAKDLFQSELNSIFENKGKGWEEKKLGEVAKHSLGKMLDKNKNKGVPQKYLRNQSVRWFGFDLSDLTEMLFLETEKEKYTAINGDILICEGGYPGRAAIWEEDYPIYFQKAIHRVRFNDKSYNKWFLYYLFLLDSNGTLKAYFSGTGIQHFTGEALARFILPLPPPNEAKKFVSQLDTLSTETKNLENIYQQKLNALEELKKSILQKAFSGELTSPERASSDNDGWSPSKKKASSIKSPERA